MLINLLGLFEKLQVNKYSEVNSVGSPNSMSMSKSSEGGNVSLFEKEIFTDIINDLRMKLS